MGIESIPLPLCMLHRPHQSTSLSKEPAMGAGGAASIALTGAAAFKRVNTMSDRFVIHGFHSIEFWCADATNTYKR
jgi:hypothetical protein